VSLSKKQARIKKAAKHSGGHIHRRPTEGFKGVKGGNTPLPPQVRRPQIPWTCDVSAECQGPVQEACNACGAWMCTEHGKWDVIEGLDLCVGCYEEGFLDGYSKPGGG